MKLTSFLSHHRLFVNILVLAVALGVLALAPAANARKGTCDIGCIVWDIQNGCTRYMMCCAARPNDWACVEWSPQNQ